MTGIPASTQGEYVGVLAEKEIMMEWLLFFLPKISVPKFAIYQLLEQPFLQIPGLLVSETPQLAEQYSRHYAKLNVSSLPPPLLQAEATLRISNFNKSDSKAFQSPITFLFPFSSGINRSAYKCKSPLPIPYFCTIAI